MKYLAIKGGAEMSLQMKKILIVEGVERDGELVLVTELTGNA